MGDSVAKLQAIEGSGAEYSRDYITRSAPSPIPTKKEFDEKAQHSSQHGFTSTTLHQPVMYSYSTQYQPLGRQAQFNMRNFGAALPEILYQGYGNISGPRCMLGSPQYPNHFMYHVPQLQQLPGHPAIPPPISNLSYYDVLQAQLQNTYIMRPNASSNLTSRVNVGNYSFQNPAYNGQTPSFFLQSTPYSFQNQVSNNPQSIEIQSMKPLHLDESQESLDCQSSLNSSVQSKYKNTVNQSQSVVVRGPPRKPRQSGHAIWIGNLPPHTEIMSLVRHVCKETKGLESLFLISKSNCAFANFRDEEACMAAQAKIHDSRFQTVRLVSRLRRSSSGAKSSMTVPTGPSASIEPTTQALTETKNETSTEVKSVPKDKFFVVKSLTVEDLELSVKNKIWATQSHNEKLLNEAYKTSDNVFLIFSANKSGEYFGYARMVSPINDDPAAVIEFASQTQATKDPILPNIVLSPASGFAPKGRIIDDSTRGTIFWEVDKDGEGDEDEVDEIESDKSISEELPPKLWGKPFEVEWISTVRLPFHRTRGLRNPWNSNREVKIARDGTELETSTGKRLIALFHRLPSPVPPPVPGMPLPMMGGYQQIHRFS